jgi:flagella basal body P-ring formation protein FlgA
MIRLRLRPRAILSLLAAVAAAAPVGAATPRQDPAPVAAAVRQAALALAPPGATIAVGPVAGAAYMQACAGALTVTLSGTAPYEQAAAHCASPAWTLYVTVTVAESEIVATAARPLAAGQMFGPADIRMVSEPVALFAGRQVFYDPAAIIGAQSLMALAAGGLITASDLVQPVIVKAGQTVTVQVVSGQVSVSITAVADQTGRIGDTILLTNPGSGRRFSATCTAAGPIVRLQS